MRTLEKRLGAFDAEKLKHSILTEVKTSLLKL